MCIVRMDDNKLHAFVSKRLVTLDDEPNSIDLEGRTTHWKDLYMPKGCRLLDAEKNSNNERADLSSVPLHKPDINHLHDKPIISHLLSKPGIGSLIHKPVGPITGGISGQLTHGASSGSFGIGGGHQNSQQTGSQSGFGVGGQFTHGQHQGSFQIGGGITKPPHGSSNNIRELFILVHLIKIHFIQVMFMKSQVSYMEVHSHIQVLMGKFLVALVIKGVPIKIKGAPIRTRVDQISLEEVFSMGDLLLM